MTAYLSREEVIALHSAIVEASGEPPGFRDAGRLEASIAVQWHTFGGEDLYPTVVDKAAALGFCIVVGQPFIQGNKRTGHAAMESLLITNGYELRASVDEQEAVILAVAYPAMGLESFTAWLYGVVFEWQARKRGRRP